MKEVRDTFYSKKKMLRLFNKQARHWRKVLQGRFSGGDVSDIIDRAEREFLSIASRLPDIGGKSNFLTFHIIESAVILAYYKALKARNMNVEEIGGITHDVIRERVLSYPSFMLRLRGAYLMSGYCQKRRKQQAERSQRKTYPGDWVYRFVEGDGKTFHYGIDYTECGICTLYESENAREFTPFLCDIDYITFDAFGIGLHRAKTLGKGDDLCNFRFMMK
ncbi:MAG: L-2-amino-thiazoline-4-carboxylic acid hydrolase [Deltaproteobacteria bacterium]|nr:L-2-amino-thiazoline-4-carboxylic acid hydrolase [Candidatus Zymogenaceae bacterium]